MLKVLLKRYHNELRDGIVMKSRGNQFRSLPTSDKITNLDEF